MEMRDLSLSRKDQRQGLGITKVLNHRLRLSSRFFQNFAWHFFDGYMEFEHWGLASSAPSAHLPVSAQEFDVGLPGDIQQQRMLRPVELLREVCDRFWIPSCAVGRFLNAYVQRFLLNDPRNVQAQKKNAARGLANVHRRTIALSVDHGLFRN